MSRRSKTLPAIFSIHQMKLFAACQRMHGYRYGENLRARDPGFHRTLAIGVRRALAVYYKTADLVSALDESDRALEGSPYAAGLRDLVHGMLVGYADWNLPHDDFAVLGVDAPFACRVRTPSSRRSAKDALAGLADILVRREDGSLWLVRHKTAQSLGENLVQKLKADFSLRAEWWAVSEYLGETLEGVLVNILRSKLPTIPKRNQCPSCKGTGTKSGAACPACSGSGLGGLSKRADIDTTVDVFMGEILRFGFNSDEYRDILDNLALREADGNHPFYARVELRFDEEERDEIEREIYQLARNVRTCRRPCRNTHACSLYGSCDYWNLCFESRMDQAERERRFERLPDPHPEFKQIDMAARLGEAGKGLQRLTANTCDCGIRS
jgi:hypothetical protein